MEQMICVRHMNRLKEGYLNIEGVGDCRICQPHPDNQYCKLYYPIKIQVESCLPPQSSDNQT
jgi:hypothetical protein